MPSRAFPAIRDWESKLPPWATALLAVAVLVAYPMIGLYPYQWEVPRVVANTVEPAPGAGLRFPGPGPVLPARTGRRNGSMPP